jgi:hypothetical protein
MPPSDAAGGAQQWRYAEGVTLEVKVLRMMKELGDPVQSAIRLRHWLILNARALTWLALAVGGVLFVGVFLNQ